MNCAGAQFKSRNEARNHGEAKSCAKRKSFCLNNELRLAARELTSGHELCFAHELRLGA